MSANLLDLVKGAVSDQIMGQLGGLLGTDAKKTPSLFETAAGSILGGLMKKGADPQGAKDIFGAIEKQDDSILDKLGDLMGGGDATDELQNQGSGILDMVMGGSKQTEGMVGMIAKALGVDKGIIGKLLMMAAPVVMGVIGRHLKAKAMDAVGLGKLLGEQKSHLADAMPSSLVSNLGFGDMLGKAGNLAGSATDTIGNVGSAAGDVAKSGGSLLKYIVPLGLLAIAAFFFGPRVMDMMSRSSNAGIDPSEITAPAMPNVGEMGMDFSSIPGLDALGEKGKTLTTGFSDITSGLKDVSSEDGAASLAERITGFTGKIDGLGLGDLDGVAKTATSGIVAKFVEAVKGMLSGKSDGIQGILKPVIDALMEKLAPLAG